MKSKFLSLLIISILAVITVSAQNSSKKNSPVGSWKFEAQYAPEGYTSGTMIVGLAEQKYSASMSFTGNEVKLTGDMVKFENDNLIFSVYVEGENVKVALKIDGENKMSGKASYSQGEVPLTLTKNAVLIQK
jgi:hypothetical protein